MKLATAALFSTCVFSNALVHAEDGVVFVISSEADGLLQTPVTQQWYGKGLGQDWRNLQVKDTLGNPVPFRFVQHAPPLTEATEDSALPLFFITVADNGAPETVAPAIIRVTPETIEIMTEPSQTRPPSSTDQYLVDLRDVENKPATLVFDWQGDEANRIYPLTVHYSNDLTHWQTAGQYTLTKLIANDTRLEQNTLELPRHAADYAYLKLTFDLTAKVVINKLYGRRITKTKTAAEVLQWSVSGALASNQSYALVSKHDRTEAKPVTAWEYQRNEQTPATSVFIDFQDQSFIGDVRVLTKNPADPYWQQVRTGAWHHVHHQDRWYSSAALPLNQQATSQWRLETIAGASPQAAPVLRFSTPQWHFQMVANGNFPYSLIRSDTANDSTLSQMRGVFGSLGLNNESPATDVAIALEFSPPTASKNDTRWQYLSFWVLLIGASAVMLYFVFRLFRTEKNAPT